MLALGEEGRDASRWATAARKDDEKECAARRRRARVRAVCGRTDDTRRARAAGENVRNQFCMAAAQLENGTRLVLPQPNISMDL